MGCDHRRSQGQAVASSSAPLPDHSDRFPCCQSMLFFPFSVIGAAARDITWEKLRHPALLASKRR